MDRVSKDVQKISIDLFSAVDKLSSISSAWNTATNALISAEEAKKNKGLDLEKIYKEAQEKQRIAEENAKKRKAEQERLKRKKQEMAEAAERKAKEEARKKKEKEERAKVEA